MVSIVCDSCKRVVPNAYRGETYFTLVNRELCKSCYKDLLLKVEDTLEPRRPHYTLAGYKSELLTTLSRLTK